MISWLILLNILIINTATTCKHCLPTELCSAQIFFFFPQGTGDQVWFCPQVKISPSNSSVFIFYLFLCA